MSAGAGHEWNNFTHTANELVTVAEGRMRFTFFDCDHHLLEPGGLPFSLPLALPPLQCAPLGLRCARLPCCLGTVALTWSGLPGILR